MPLEAPKVRAGACAAARLEGPGQTAHHQERAVRLQRPRRARARGPWGQASRTGECREEQSLRLSLDKGRLYPPCSRGLWNKAEAQAASGATLKADSKEESMGTTVKIRKFPSRGADKPALVLSLVSGWSRAGSNQRELPGEGTTRDFSGGPSSSVQGPLRDPATGRKSKGELLKYIVYGDRSVEHPKKKRPRPRKNSHNPEDVPVRLALRTQIRALPRQEFLTDERAKYRRTESKVSHIHTFYRSRLRFQQRFGERKRGVLQAPGIRMHSTGRGHKIPLEEIGKQTGSNSITRKNKRLFCRHPSPSHTFII